jgi:hypothetical protein
MKFLHVYIFNKTIAIIQISKHNWVEKMIMNFDGNLEQ